MGLRHAKIVCTLGPATDDVKAIGALIDAGMDVARLNFSHGTHEEHARRIAAVREESRARGKPIAVLQDLQGPKIRTGQACPRKSPRARRSGWPRAEVGCWIPRHDRHRIRRPGGGSAAGDFVRLDDGRIALRVDRIGPAGSPARWCRAARCATAWASTSRRGACGSPRSPSRTGATAHGLAMGVDYVALSFVKRADDIVALRDVCKQGGRRRRSWPRSRRRTRSRTWGRWSPRRTP